MLIKRHRVRADVEERVLLKLARLAFDCFLFFFGLVWVTRDYGLLSCVLWDRSKHQYWIYLRDCETRWSVVSRDVCISPTSVPSF